MPPADNDARLSMSDIAVVMHGNGRSHDEIASALGVSTQVVTRWVNNTKQRSTKANLDRKLEIYQRLKNGARQLDVAKEFNISQSLVSDIWRKFSSEDDKKKYDGRPRINIPDGMTAEQLVLRGLEMEEAGTTIEEICRQFKVYGPNYRKMRDIVLLSKRNDLSPEAAATVADALKIMNETRRVSQVYDDIAPIVEQVWGGNSFHRNEKVIAQRREQFRAAITHVSEVCDMAKETELPHVEAEQVEWALRQISKSIGELKELQEKIRRTYK